MKNQKIMKNDPSMKNLGRTKTHRNQVSCQLGRKFALVQARSLKTENDWLDLEQIAITWCQPYIFAQPNFDQKPPLAQKELLFEVPSPRVILMNIPRTMLWQGDFASKTS